MNQLTRNNEAIATKPRIPLVMEAMNDVREALEGLEKEVTMLIDKLQPVCSPMPPQDQRGCPVEGCTVPLAGDISMQARRIHEFATALQTLRMRVEL